MGNRSFLEDEWGSINVGDFVFNRRVNTLSKYELYHGAISEIFCQKDPNPDEAEQIKQ